ncbi:MAG: regulatory protein GemA [Gammaproteobacteria bacterium]|nr:regulatory protein GemA [Gammaproteobacteria bacterium]
MTDPRARLRRGIFAACRGSGLSDEDRRAVQLEVTGRASLTDMSAGDMRRVLDSLNRGRSRTTGVLLPRGALARKMQALWLSGWNLGVVRDPGHRALAAFVCRTAGLDSALWADERHQSMVIEALKAMLARDAGVDWSPRKSGSNDPQIRVIEAQLDILRGLRGLGRYDEETVCENPVDEMNRLGRLIREASG